MIRALPFDLTHNNALLPALEDIGSLNATAVLGGAHTRLDDGEIVHGPEAVGLRLQVAVARAGLALWFLLLHFAACLAWCDKSLKAMIGSDSFAPTAISSPTRTPRSSLAASSQKAIACCCADALSNLALASGPYLPAIWKWAKLSSRERSERRGKKRARGSRSKGCWRSIRYRGWARCRSYSVRTGLSPDLSLDRKVLKSGSSVGPTFLGTILPSPPYAGHYMRGTDQGKVPCHRRR